MTILLQQAFEKISLLSDEEQDLLASWLLAELDAEDAFDRRIEETAEKLAPLSQKAIDDYRAGLTEELVPEQL